MRRDNLDSFTAAGGSRQRVIHYYNDVERQLVGSPGCGVGRAGNGGTHYHAIVWRARPLFPGIILWRCWGSGSEPWELLDWERNIRQWAYFNHGSKAIQGTGPILRSLTYVIPAGAPRVGGMIVLPQSRGGRGKRGAGSPNSGAVPPTEVAGGQCFEFGEDFRVVALRG